MEKKSKNYNWGVGIALGVALGVALNNIAIGIALGIAFAAAFAESEQKKDKTDADGNREPLPPQEPQSPDDLPSIDE